MAGPDGVGLEDLLAAASAHAHRVTARANAVALTRGDGAWLRMVMAKAQSALLDADEDINMHATPTMLKALNSALRSCLETIETSVCATNPASALLLSGAIARRLRECLCCVGAALGALADCVGEGRSAELRALQHQLSHPQLNSLDQAAARAAELGVRVAAAADQPGPGSSRGRRSPVAACVAQGLLRAGLEEEALDQDEARRLLAQELLDLPAKLQRGSGGQGAGITLTQGELDLITSVAGALLDMPSGEGPEGAASAAGPAAGGAAGGSARTSASGAAAGCAKRRPRIPRSFVCAITHCLMRDPAVTSAGNSYEREALMEWLRLHSTDPLTGERLESPTLRPNFALKGAIDELLDELGVEHDTADAWLAAGEVGACMPSQQPHSSSPREPPAQGAAGGDAAGPSTSTQPAAPSGAAFPAAGAPGGSPAYTTFANVSQWYQVTDMDAAAKEHLKREHVTPAVARALTEVMGFICLSDLAGGAVDEQHVRLMQLKPLDERRLLRAVESAREALAAGGGTRGHTGPGVLPVLLDYVTVVPGYQDMLDAGSGPLTPGKYGIIVMDDRQEERPVRVRSLQEPYGTWWYPRAALTAVPESAVPEALRLSFPYDAVGRRCLGAPVTHWTSEPGMLVRRGYDWDSSREEAHGQDGEVGMLVSSDMGGRTWKVYWAKGGSGVYRTGADDIWELCHVQTDRLGGAPVVSEAAVVAGCGVVRGLHWTWAQQDGGPGNVGALQEDDQTGHVAVLWPNHRLARYRASTQQGFDLAYAARLGEPVTVYTAQGGAPVTRGRDWCWASQDGDGMVGVLLRPVTGNSECVLWEVEWSDGSRNRYRVGRSLRSSCCDLMFAMYESDGPAGRLLTGTPVVLSSDYRLHGDAKAGPLKPGKVGVVVDGGEGIGGTPRYKVLHIRTGQMWWYDRAALRPLPPHVAVQQSGRLRLNRDGRVVFLGRSSPTEEASQNGTPPNGGDTGRLPQQNYYCGAQMNQCRCGHCDGTCGPDNGCPCHACVELIGKRITPEGALEDSPAAGSTSAAAAQPAAAAANDDSFSFFPGGGSGDGGSSGHGAAASGRDAGGAGGGGGGGGGPGGGGGGASGGGAAGGAAGGSGAGGGGAGPRAAAGSSASMSGGGSGGGFLRRWFMGRRSDTGARTGDAGGGAAGAGGGTGSGAAGRAGAAGAGAAGDGGSAGVWAVGRSENRAGTGRGGRGQGRGRGRASALSALDAGGMLDMLALSSRMDDALREQPSEADEWRYY